MQTACLHHTPRKAIGYALWEYPQLIECAKKALLGKSADDIQHPDFVPSPVAVTQCFLASERRRLFLASSD